MFDFSKNYFELFGMPVGYVIDNAALDQRYRELQKVVHPDRFAAAGAQSQRISLQSATQVNEAYTALKDPLKRAHYLLGLMGVEGPGDTATLNDPAFLMQQMELREELAEVRSHADPHARLDELLHAIAGMIRTHIVQLAVQFEDASADSLQSAFDTLQKMQFLEKLRTEAEALEAELEEAY